MKAYKSLIFLLVLIIAESCQKDTELENHQIERLAIRNNSIDSKDSTLFNALLAVGFVDSTILDIGDSYLVGDMLFAKRRTDIEFLKSFFSKDTRADSTTINPMQAHTPLGVYTLYTHNQSFSLTMEASVFQNNWVNAVSAACEQWRIGSTFRVPGLPDWYDAIFVDLGIDQNTQYPPTSEYSPWEIRVEGDNGVLPNNVIAAAEFPYVSIFGEYWGSPGFRIRINYDFNNNMSVSESTKLHNMVHEIGHCLGMRHTNWQGLGEPAASQVPNTPSGANPDPSSFMNGGTALNSWAGFSEYDRVAVSYLFPRVMETR